MQESKLNRYKSANDSSVKTPSKGTGVVSPPAPYNNGNLSHNWKQTATSRAARACVVVEELRINPNFISQIIFHRLFFRFVWIEDGVSTQYVDTVKNTKFTGLDDGITRVGINIPIFLNEPCTVHLYSLRQKNLTGDNIEDYIQIGSAAIETIKDIERDANLFSQPFALKSDTTEVGFLKLNGTHAVFQNLSPGYGESKNKYESDTSKLQKDEMIRKKQEQVIKEGDYLVKIHIIEAKGLVRSQSNKKNLCDPIVFAKLWGKTFHTSVKKKTNNPIWDEFLFMEFSSITKKQLQSGVLEISINNVDTIFKRELVGKYSFDVHHIYYMNNHEMYRQWISVSNFVDDGVANSGRGFLRLSITVLGPDDKEVEHNITDELLAEAIEEGDGNIDSLVLLPPNVKQYVWFLVITIYRGEHFPIVDNDLIRKLGKNVGIDPYYKFQFGSADKVTSTRKKIRGSSLSLINEALCADFGEKIWIPVLLPCMSTSITVGLWDFNKSKQNKCIGTVSVAWDDIMALHEQQKLTKETVEDVPKWYNFYGSPLLKTINSSQKWKKLMNRFPDEATNYRGRVLLSFRVDENTKGAVVERAHREVCDFKIHRILQNEVPTEKFCLRAYIYYGCELPFFKSSKGGIKKLSIRMSIGPHTLQTQRCVNKNGVVWWMQTLETKLRLSKDSRQIPDLFIYINNGAVRYDNNQDANNVSYIRLNAGDLINKNFKENVKWYHFVEDPSLRALGLQNPGSVMMRVGLGPLDVASANPWSNEPSAISSPSNFKRFQVRIHMYQMRNLLGVNESDGFSDPYVNVYCCGKKVQFEKVLQTTSPSWYETKIIETDILTVEAENEEEKKKSLSSNYLQFAPLLSLHILDWNPWGTDTRLGSIHIEPDDFLYVACDKASDSLPLPVWRKLRNFDNTREVIKNQSDNGLGEVLCSVSFVELETQETLPNYSIERLCPPNIIPEVRRCYVEIIAIGLRNLKRLNLPLSSPYVEFDTGHFMQKQKYPKTKPSKLPSVTNPNFLERILIPIDIPNNPLYAPTINIIVRDMLFAGLVRPILGRISISLNRKIPSTDEHPNPYYDSDKEEKRGRMSRYSTKELLLKEDDMNRINQYRRSNVFVNVTHVSTTTRSSSQALSIRYTQLQSESTSLSVNSHHRDSIEKDSESASRVHPEVADTNESLFAESQFETDDYEDYDEADNFDSGMYSVVTPSYHGLDENIAEEMLTYLIGRGEIDGELEESIENSPFETYDIFRGSEMKKKIFGISVKKTRKIIGTFKGVINIIESNNEEDIVSPNVDIESVLNPKEYIVRAYILQGKYLVPTIKARDANAYLKLQIGDDLSDSKTKCIKSDINPKFHQSFEFLARLPGPPLQIQVWDHHKFGRDRIIGETRIDLEDRWFSRSWQDLGQSQDLEDDTFPTKPTENRTLWTATSSVSQGRLWMWLDIMEKDTASSFHIVDITVPPPEKFEVRVIIWRGDGIVSLGRKANICDPQIICRIGQGKPQKTDIHWRAKNGKASWNWRMKFDVELPMEEGWDSQMEFQLVDKKLVGPDKLTASAIINLESYFKRAFRTKDVVNCFGKAESAKAFFTSENLDHEGVQSVQSNVSSNSVSNYPNDTYSDGGTRINKNEKHTMDHVYYNGDSEDDNYSSLVQNVETNITKERDKENFYSEEDSEEYIERNERLERINAINEIKERLGMDVSVNPLDADWLTFLDVFSSDPCVLGRLLVSIEIVPKDVAEQRPNGFGRNKPNEFPKLPKPMGRIKFSLKFLNPCYLMKKLCGKACSRACGMSCFCILLIAGTIVALFFGGQIISSFMSTVAAMEALLPSFLFGILKYILLIIFVLLVCSCCYCYISCRIKKMNEGIMIRKPWQMWKKDR